MKYLITGGAGFIGSAVVRHLITETKHEVINIDKLTYAGNLQSLKSIIDSKRYFFENIDICNSGEIKRVIYSYKPNIILHLAAESHVDRSIDGPATFMQTNIIGTSVLLEEVRNYYNDLNGEYKDIFRFHHISTDEVYGDLPHPDNIEKAKNLPLFTENNPYAPSSPYSASKASSDHLVRAWNRTYSLPTIITNCSNNYGHYQFPEKLIPLVILNAIEGKPLPVYGKGNQIRDWLYVEDHVRALLLCSSEGKIGQTYNIGGNNEMRNIDVIHKICDILDELKPKSKGKYRDQITHVADRPGHDMRYAMDISKIHMELNWKPKETFETGIIKTVKWYLENRLWCQHVKDGSYQGQRLGIS